MATPKNLNAEFPDYCSGCIHGDYEIDRIHLFAHDEYTIICTHQEACIDWVNKINAESRHKEVADET